MIANPVLFLFPLFGPPVWQSTKKRLQATLMFAFFFAMHLRYFLSAAVWTAGEIDAGDIYGKHCLFRGSLLACLWFMPAYFPSSSSPRDKCTTPTKFRNPVSCIGCLPSQSHHYSCASQQWRTDVTDPHPSEHSHATSLEKAQCMPLYRARFKGL